MLRMNTCVFFAGLCFFFPYVDGSIQSLPEQIHISYGDNPESMVVMWSSHDMIPHDVTYGTSRDRLNMTVDSSSIKVPKVASKAVPFLYRAVMKNLTQGIQYFYKITASDPQTKTVKYKSDLYSFTTQNDTQAKIDGHGLSGSELERNDCQAYNVPYCTMLCTLQNWKHHAAEKTKPFRFLFYGDMGAKKPIPTYDVLERLVRSGNYTAIFHIGDFAYDLKDEEGRVGDTFFNKIQPFASRIPYMPTIGNHEIVHNFIHYRTRFTTPGTAWPIPLDKMWYSYDIGPVHFISYSSEVFFTYNEYYVCTQFDWLLNDLTTANQNRDKRPWIIAMAHRPMYCSNRNMDDCTNRLLYQRWVKYGLEDLFYAQGVDLILQAHEHSYERLWPVYKDEVYGHSYVNPRAPVHVISGAAGSHENLNYMSQGKPSPWSAFRADKKSRYTIGQLDIHNSTHLYIEQRDTTDNGILDGFWLIKEKHGPFIINVTCNGADRHKSCVCPPPILYVYYKVGVALFGSMILVFIATTIYVYVYKRKQRHKTTGNSYIKYTKLGAESEKETVLNLNSCIDESSLNTNDTKHLNGLPSLASYNEQLGSHDVEAIDNNNDEDFKLLRQS